MRYIFINKRLSMIYTAVILLIFSIFYVFGSVSLPTSTTANRKIPIYRVNRDDNKIALTFDVAWDDKDTEAILDALDKYKVKASFFIVGEWLDHYPKSSQLILSRGHEILNHSDTHPYMTKISETEMSNEILDCDKRIFNLTKKKLGLFRPPYGDYNNSVVSVAESVDHKVIQWDVDSLDWQDLSAQEITKRVMDKTKSGSIILLHLGAKNTPEALDILLPELIKKGYKPVKVSSLIYKDNYTIDHAGMQISN
ncbi:MAG: polysaccharide deacetylase family protein [Eubacteriales bacterium]|nr:polysaccharide deacetylase family protein [Eubacteriales bacterium]